MNMKMDKIKIKDGNMMHKVKKNQKVNKINENSEYKQ